MKRIIQVIAVACLAICAHAQNWTTVSASNITDLNQQKLAAGRLCFLITDLNDNPISVMIGGGGQSLQRPYCSTITTGAVTSFTVPNPANTSPANIAYRVTATDSSTGQLVIRYAVVQFTGTTFNFDTYVPSANLPLGVSANILSVGNLTITGTCSGCAVGSGYNLIQQAGTNLAQRLTLNFVSGVTCTDNVGQLRTDCTVSGGSGTVTSVGLSLPSIFSVSGSPVTTSGTLTGTLANESANTVFAGPTTGSAAAPTFRALVSADIPNNAANTTGTAATITGALALGNTPLTTLGDTLYANSTPALARLAGQTSTTKEYLSQTGTGSVSAAPAWAQINFADIAGTVANSQLANSYSGIGACASHQWASTLNANAAPTCTQPAYSDISGTPTLYYQTVQNASGTGMAQEPKVEFTGTAVSSVTDDSANNRTVVTLTASAGSGVTLQTGGTNNSSQTTLNFQNGSTVDGIQIQPTNPSGGNEQMAISGTLTVPGGGTGLTTLTAHELYVGNGTSNPNPVATGSAGQVLISNGGSSDPTFQDPVISYNNPSETTAAWTSSTSLNTAVTLNLQVGSGVLSTVTVTLNQGTTITAGAATFYVSDTTGATNIYPLTCRQKNTGTPVNVYSLQASTNASFVCNVAGFEGFQIKLTTAITGTGTVNVGLQPTSAPTVDDVVVQQSSGSNLHVNVDSAPTTTVTGTVAATESGTWTVQPGNTANTTAWKVDGSAVTQPVSGTVTANAGTGTFNIQSNASVNVNQVAGSSVSTAATGTQLVGIADGAGNKLTSNSTTTTSKFGLDANILSILGTAPTTAGKLDVKGADGDVFVRQATASNLNATVVQSGTWTVQPGNTANTTPWLVQGSLSNNGAAAATNRIGTLDGVAQTDYNNGTASTQGRDVAPNVGTDGLLWTVALPAMRPASYHANANFAASSTTDNAVLPGNASDTVLVTKVTVSCTQTTAGIVLMKIIKRSTADTSGTSASMTAVPDDSNYAAASSAPLSYTGTGPTAGTAVGNVDTYYLGCLASGTATPNDIYVLNLRQKPIVLRGTAQQLAVNFNNSALTGGNLNVTFEWIETKTITP